MAKAFLVKAANNTGNWASDLHVTLSGSDGNLFVNPGGVIVTPGPCPVPQVPSNPPKVTNEVVLDWGTPCVAPCATVWFSVLTGVGPLQFVSGFWTSIVNGVPDTNIGPVEPGDVDVSPLYTKIVLNSSGISSEFARSRIVGDLVIGGLAGEAAISRANQLETILDAAGANPVSTDALRHALGELSIRPDQPDVARISAFVRFNRSQ
jgi:hypothetical protein